MSTTAQSVAAEYGTLRLFMRGKRQGQTILTFIYELPERRLLIESSACGKRALAWLWHGPDGELTAPCGALRSDNDGDDWGGDGLLPLTPGLSRELLLSPLDLRTTLDGARQWCSRLSRRQGSSRSRSVPEGQLLVAAGGDACRM